MSWPCFYATTTGLILAARSTLTLVCRRMCSEPLRPASLASLPNVIVKQPRLDHLPGLVGEHEIAIRPLGSGEAGRGLIRAVLAQDPGQLLAEIHDPGAPVGLRLADGDLAADLDRVLADFERAFVQVDAGQRSASTRPTGPSGPTWAQMMNGAAQTAQAANAAVNAKPTSGA